MKDQIRSSKSKDKKHSKNAPWRWIITIFIMTIIISGTFSFLSNIVLDASGIIISLVVLLVIILIGILFDIIGVAVTAADVQSIHGMASRKVKGAGVAADLIKHANKVSSICNDVIGDICGVVSGSATAVIAVRILADNHIRLIDKLVPIVLSALVAALTVSGKAIGKIIALEHSTDIIFNTGKCLSIFRRNKKSGARKRA